MFRRFFKRVRKFFGRNKKVQPKTIVETESSSPDIAAPQEFCQTEDMTQRKDFLVEEYKTENPIEMPVQEPTDEEIEDPIESLNEELSDEEESENSSTSNEELTDEPQDNIIMVKEAVECLDTLMDPQCPECASPAEIIMQDEENVVADSETGDKNICTERSERFSLLSVLSLSDESSEEHISTGSSDTEPPMMIKVTVTPKRNTQVEETENQSDSPEPLDNPEYLEEPNEYKRQEEDSQDATPPNDSDFFGIEIPSLNLQLDGIETSSDSSERAYCLEMALPAFSHLRNSPEYRSESVRSRTLSMSNTSSEDFDLLSMLGQGNFGKVFLSDHKPTNSKFAVKAIPRRKYDQHAAQRIQTEKDIMQLVTDKKAPFLVGLDASFVTNYNECLVMEYAPGGDLRSLMDKYDLPLECTRFYAACIVLGVKFLHDNKIVHRDLKPENILLDKRGYPRITDYGISTTGIGFGQRMCNQCGTRPYMAPELFTEPYYTRSVDWWALGVIIYEMILRELPFDGDNGDEIRMKIIRKRPKYPLTLPAHVRDILQGLLNKNAALRLGSTVEGAHVVMERPFFFGMNWEALRRKEIKPMFIMNNTGTVPLTETELSDWEL